MTRWVMTAEMSYLLCTCKEKSTPLPPRHQSSSDRSFLPPQNLTLFFDTDELHSFTGVQVAMSETPSWFILPLILSPSFLHRLVDESTVTTVATTVVSNPTVQKAGKAAVVAAVEEESSNYFDSKPTGDLEAPLNPTRDSADDESDLQISPEELRQLEKWNLILRVSYMTMSILMAAASCLSLNDSSLGTVFVALYVFIFAVIICCFELALKGVAFFIAENFGFLYTKTGRLIFMVFVAVMCFDLDVIGKVSMALLLLLVCINIYVFLTLPKYESWLRNKHFSHVLGKKR
jgi:hypothetical protein